MTPSPSVRVPHPIYGYFTRVHRRGRYRRQFRAEHEYGEFPLCEIVGAHGTVQGRQSFANTTNPPELNASVDAFTGDPRKLAENGRTLRPYPYSRVGLKITCEPNWSPRQGQDRRPSAAPVRVLAPPWPVIRWAPWQAATNIAPVNLRVLSRLGIPDAVLAAFTLLASGSGYELIATRRRR